jgi:hypothetical protein
MCSVSPLCINRHVITGITEAVYEVGVNCKEIALKIVKRITSVILFKVEWLHLRRKR